MFLILNLRDYVDLNEDVFGKGLNSDAGAGGLAWKLGIGRTTLMTAFKSYTGSTLQEHILRYRLSKAIKMLSSGLTEQVVAEACGFGDPCTLIRSFKKVTGMTPREYRESKKTE